MTDPFVGQLAFFRVYSGSLNSGAYVYNSTKQRRERIGRLLKMHANKREEIKEVLAGDIAAAVGLRDVTTGDTICDENKPILLEVDGFPGARHSVAIEPKTKADQEKMGVALGKLAQEDPTFKIHTDPDTAQTIISGMGELHLEIIVDRMMREFNVARQRRQAAGCLQGNDPQEGRSRRQIHPPDRRPRPVRPREDHRRAQWSRARVSFSKTKSSAARFRRNTSSRSSRAFAKPCRPAFSPATK